MKCNLKVMLSVAALIAAGFGTAGQILATNATADGFEWVDAPL